MTVLATSAVFALMVVSALLVVIAAWNVFRFSVPDVAPPLIPKVISPAAVTVIADVTSVVMVADGVPMPFRLTARSPALFVMLTAKAPAAGEAIDEPFWRFSEDVSMLTKPAKP